MAITDMSEHYRSLIIQSSKVFESIVSDQEMENAFTISHNYSEDYHIISRSIEGRPEARLLALANREYQFALFAAAGGSYRHAFISLRLFMELFLAAIYFSAYEIRLRKWLSNSGDIVWGTLIDKENGVFSHSFIGAFSPGLEPNAKQYAAIAEKVYRECSEFVHGNNHTHGQPEEPLQYTAESLSAWTEKAAAVRIAVLFAFAARYLRFLQVEKRNSLEALISDSLGHLPGINSVFTE